MKTQTNTNDLITRFPDASSYRGASMGRPSHHALDKNKPVALSVTRVRLDSGGYDKGGAYWGVGSPLYRCMSEEEVKLSTGEIGHIDFYFRHTDPSVIARYLRSRPTCGYGYTNANVEIV